MPDADTLLVRDHEAERAAVIAAHDLGSLREHAELKQITDFAAALCEAPMATVSLVDEAEQVFLARTGLARDRTPRRESLCAHAMLGDTIMVVPDATKDSRFAANPLVTGEMHLRFYAGAPLVTDDGIPLGALCVIDTKPREGLTPLQRQGLETLAADVMARMRVSRDAAAWREAEGVAHDRLVESERRFRVLADSMPQMVWSTLPDGFHDYYNARWYEFTGAPVGTTDGEGWNDMFHADDQERAWATWRHSLDTGEPYQIEYRLRHHDGTYRWVLGRALPMRDDTGAIMRWFGTCTDIHEQKLASEEREIVSQELSHRIKNIFAVVSGLIQFAARAQPQFAGIATDLRHRITALGRAHDFVRPHSNQSRPMGKQDSLHGLLDDLFEPYQQAATRRIEIVGDEITIDDRATTPIALFFHELATNATKYGALSTPEGEVTVEVEEDGDEVVLHWTERGGPPVSGAAASGFGSQLIELSAVRQLAGRVERDWRPEGLRLIARIPRASFSRSR